jgi:hypothetical protein
MQADNVAVLGTSRLSEYSTGALQYPTDKHSPREVVRVLLDSLHRSEIVQRHDDLYFIGHSFGGIVITLLLNAAASPGSGFGGIVAKTKAVFFVATPFGGISKDSPLLKLAEQYAPGLALGLRPLEDNELLSDMRARWIGLKKERETRKFPIYQACAYEKQPTKLVRFWWTSSLLVEESSMAAVCSPELLTPINADHMAIVKPDDRESKIYQWLKFGLAEAERLRASRDAIASNDIRAEAERMPHAAAPPTAAAPQSEHGLPSKPAPAPAMKPTEPVPAGQQPSSEISPPTGQGETVPGTVRLRPTDKERRAAEERRLAEKLFAAQQAAHDLEMIRRDEEAVGRDNEKENIVDAHVEYERDARAAAGLGFRLRENTSVAGSSFANVLASSVAECALACERQACDGFGFYRAQYPRGSKRARYCYLFREPFEPANYPGYAFGERMGDPHLIGVMRRVSTEVEGAVQVAQGSSSAGKEDGVVRCAGGAVKVTGFKLTCDRIMAGGTTLGSVRLSYTVAHINECAAKCRPVAKCVGFTFNSGDPDGQHACVIFGPTPETREAAGWISGVR